MLTIERNEIQKNWIWLRDKLLLLLLSLTWNTTKNWNENEKDKTKKTYKHIRILDICIDIKHVLIMTIPFTKPIKLDGCEAHNSQFMRSLREQHKYNFDGDKKKNAIKYIGISTDTHIPFETVFFGSFSNPIFSSHVSSRFMQTFTSWHFDKWIFWCQHQSVYEFSTNTKTTMTTATQT